MGTHDHHRQRLRENYLATGFKGKTDHQILELILTYAIPRIDVNPTAHLLIDKYGSLAGVLDADYDDLIEIPNLKQYGAVLLKLIPDILPIYHESKCSKRIHLNTYEKIKEYMIPKLINKTNEVFYVLCLDAHLNLIQAILHTEGIAEKATLNIRALINDVLKTGACQVVLVHNHLSGSVQPSVADIEATTKISTALSALEINLIDHLIISGENCFNLKTFEQLKDIKIFY